MATQSVYTSGDNPTFWLESTKQKEYETVTHTLSSTVLVIGGGISGLTVAYCLLEKGYSVIVVEDGLIGSGESGRTTAHLSYALDDRYYHLMDIFGEEKAKHIGHSHKDAIDQIENTIHKEKIACQFQRVDGYLFLNHTDKVVSLKKEAATLEKLGLPHAWVDTMPGIDEKGPAIKFPDQAQFHIMEYLNGLAEVIIKKGGQIYTRSKAENITKEGATVNGHKVHAKHIVVATNSACNNRLQIHMKVGSYRSYVVGVKLPKDNYISTLRWDTADKTRYAKPYHYARLEYYDAQHYLLIVGGEDHKTGQADEERIPEEARYKRLLDWTKKRFPDMKETLYTWSGQIVEPVDRIAYIGKNSNDENIYIVTGDSGNGMTYGTMAGSIITDIIEHKENPLIDIYSPSRLPWRVPKDYFQEVINTLMQYKDWLTREDTQSLKQIALNSGAIMRKGLKKIAVYRDEKGKLSVYSAVCPHLGAVLTWNESEKSFDCPCHGSRFDKEGKCVNGPAISDLKKLD